MKREDVGTGLGVGEPPGGGPGPVGTFDFELAFQGGFRVFKEGGEGLDDLYTSYKGYPEGDLKSRTRIAWVEIDTTLDEIDVARVHFIDPERRIAGYVAESWVSTLGDRANPAVQRHDVWKVMIGYHFLPEDRWVTFTGVPVIEDTEFPRDGPPEVTVRLFAPSIAMAKRNSSLPSIVNGQEVVYKSRHWLHEPYSIRRALEELARAYSLGLHLGSLGQVIDRFDALSREYFENPSAFRKKYVDRTPIGSGEDAWGHFLVYAQSEIGQWWEYRNQTLQESQRTDMRDWNYLQWLKHRLQKYVTMYFADEEKTGRVDDRFFSLPKNAGSTIVFGIRDGKLYFCRLRDLNPRIDEITVFSYQCLDHSLFSFRVITDAAQGGADAASGLAKILSIRQAAVEPAETDKTETEVETGGDDPEARYDVTGKTDRSIVRTGGDYAFHTGSAQRLAWLETATEEEILGMLATNLEAEAVVAGAPFLSAGNLVATYGLGVTGETKPEPEVPPRINALDRVWFVAGCTHRVDSTGLYTTELRLRGAGTDDSTKVPAEFAKVLQKSLETTGQSTQKPLGFWERIAGWLGF